MYLPLYYSSFRHTFLFQFPSVFFWLSSVFYSFRGSSCFCLFFVGFLGFFFFLSGVRWGSGFFFFWLLHWFAALFLYSLAVRTCWLSLFVWCDGCLNDTSHLLIGCPGLSRNFVHTRTCGATCAVLHDRRLLFAHGVHVKGRQKERWRHFVTSQKPGVSVTALDGLVQTNNCPRSRLDVPP